MCAVEMFLVALCLAVLYFIQDSAGPVTVLVLLALAGFFLYGPQALLGVTATKQATKRAASSAVGLVGFMSYLSVIFTGVGLGWFSDNFGWNHLFILMAGVSVLGGVVMVLLWNIRDDGYIHE
jgi:OPA family glycerol-3-phosphate transporter-like MFS transporter/OPA family sugar phosphate sensor protein UhpC-like MFS transporter